MSNWYSIQAKSEDEAEVMIYDEIGGFGISAKQFVADLKAVKAKTINLRLNTPGGGVFEGTAMFNALREHPARIVAHIDGLAASMGSYLAMSGDEIRIASNAFLMIHNPRGGVYGEAADMRKYADMLDKLADAAAKVYAKRTGKKPAEWMEAMKAETWYSAEEAVAAGLADEIVEAGERPRACFDLSKYSNVPAPVAAMWGKSEPTNGPKAASCDAPASANNKEISMTIESFKAFAAEHPEAVASYVEQGKKAGASEARAAEQDRLKGILAACPNRPQLALDSYFAGHDVEQVKVIVATLDAAEKAKDDEIATLRTKLAQAEARVGTTPAIGTGATAPAAAGKPDGSDPKALAEWEWENEKPQGFSTKERYVAIRVAEAKGQFRMAAKKPA